MFAFKDFVIVCSIAGIVFGSAVPVSTIEKRDLQPYTSAFLGDARQPGVLTMYRDDRNLAHTDGKHRRLVKIKLWCGDEGPISMIPWYNDHNGEDGIATHQTWGADPPHGKFHEMKIDYNNEYIKSISYAACGIAGHRKICGLSITKYNSVTKLNSGSIECNFDPANRDVRTTALHAGPSGIGNYAFLSFSGTSAHSGIIGLQSRWVDLAEY